MSCGLYKKIASAFAPAVELKRDLGRLVGSNLGADSAPDGDRVMSTTSITASGRQSIGAKSRWRPGRDSGRHSGTRDCERIGPRAYLTPKSTLAMRQ